MLNSEDNPVAWAMLLYELTDAHEHLGDLIDKIEEYDEAEYAIRLGHVFAHLNRAWHGRDHTALDTLSDAERIEHTKFPTDLPAYG